MQIFHALGPVVGGLGGGVTDPLQDGAKRHGQPGREQLSQERGLVKAALAFARRMERDGNDHVETPAAQARIVQGFAEPFRERDGGDGVAGRI